MATAGLGLACSAFAADVKNLAGEGYRWVTVNGPYAARAEAILKQIISNAPIGVKFSIEAINKGLETSLTEGLLLEASLFASCFDTEDKKEGTSAFLERRVPKFRVR